MRHIEQPPHQLLAPFIGLYLAAGTAYPAFATESNSFGLPTTQADVGGVAIRRVAAAEHFLHFGHLVRRYLPGIHGLVALPVVPITDNRFECYFSGHPLC